MMQQLTVASLSRDIKFEGFLLVRSAEQRTSSNGGKYLDMTLCDTTGDINCKMWDGTVQPPKQGSVIKVRGTVQEYNGRLQMRVERLRSPAPGDDVDPSQLMPCAPEPPEDMLSEIKRTIGRMKTPELRAILNEMLAMCGDKLMYYPAAQRVHHAERSGLLHHTLGVLRAAEAVLPLYPFLDGDLLRAGAIAHDLFRRRPAAGPFGPRRGSGPGGRPARQRDGRIRAAPFPHDYQPSWPAGPRQPPAAHVPGGGNAAPAGRYGR